MVSIRSLPAVRRALAARHQIFGTRMVLIIALPLSA
jgi:hypothetical protein